MVEPETVPVKAREPYQNPPEPVGFAPSCAVNETCAPETVPLVMRNSSPVQFGTKLTVITPPPPVELPDGVRAVSYTHLTLPTILRV